MKVVKLSKKEFVTEDGQTFPIVPPLQKEISIEEFQKLYDESCNFIESIANIGSDNPNSSRLG
jgi:hypothetical protein